jgi:hypothetical protein
LLPDEASRFVYERPTVPNIFEWNLLTVWALAVAWPLSVPLMALAFKAQHGYKPVPMERPEFWLRSLGGGFGLAALATAVLALGYLLVHGAEFPPWFAYLAVAAVLIPAGVWLMYWMFALEDLPDAVSLFVTCALLSGVLLTPVILLLRLLLRRHGGP